MELPQSYTVDFNGDGGDDLGLLGKKGSGWGSIVIAFSNWDGTFKVTNKQASVFYQQYMSAASFTAVVGDFNGDGKSSAGLFCCKVGISLSMINIE